MSRQEVIAYAVVLIGAMWMVDAGLADGVWGAVQVGMLIAGVSLWLEGMVKRVVREVLDARVERRANAQVEATKLREELRELGAAPEDLSAFRMPRL